MLVIHHLGDDRQDIRNKPHAWGIQGKCNYKLNHSSFYSGSPFLLILFTTATRTFADLLDYNADNKASER